MPLSSRMFDWARTADGRVPRSIRAARRTAARTKARRTEGTIAGYMESVVAEANRGNRGSSLPPVARSSRSTPSSPPPTRQ